MTTSPQSQAEVSKALGINQSKFSRIEQDKQIPDVYFLDEFSQFFGVDLIWLIRGESKMQASTFSPLKKVYFCTLFSKEDLEFYTEYLQDFLDNNRFFGGEIHHVQTSTDPDYPIYDLHIAFIPKDEFSKDPNVCLSSLCSFVHSHYVRLLKQDLSS